MQKIFVLLVLMVLLVGSGCAPALVSTPQNEATPVDEYTSAQEISEEIGFDMIQISDPTCTPRKFSLIDNSIAEIIYDCEQNDAEINLRMAQGDEDITGINGVEYLEEDILTIEVMFGAYNDINIAKFTNKDYTYAVSATDIDRIEFEKIIEDLVADVLAEQ